MHICERTAIHAFFEDSYPHWYHLSVNHYSLRKLLGICVAACACCLMQSTGAGARNPGIRIAPGSYYDGIMRASDGDFESAIAIFNKVLQQPNPPDAVYVDLASAYAGKSDFKNAEAYYVKALALATRKHEQDLIARIYLDQARMYAKSKRLSEAADSYRKSIKSVPGKNQFVAVLMHELADVYEKQHQWAQCAETDTAALSQMDKRLKAGRQPALVVMQLRGEMAQMLYQRARCERALGKKQEAVRDDAEGNKISDEI